MACHLHISWGVLHVQSHSGCGHKSGNSQCEQSGLAVTGTTLARTKEQRSPVCCPMVFPKPSLCFQKYHITNSVSECASGALGTAGRQREPGITHNTGPWCMKNCFRFKNNQNEPKKSTKTNQQTNLQVIFKHTFQSKRKGYFHAKPCFLALQHISWWHLCFPTLMPLWHHLKARAPGVRGDRLTAALVAGQGH